MKLMRATEPSEPQWQTCAGCQGRGFILRPDLPTPRWGAEPLSQPPRGPLAVPTRREPCEQCGGAGGILVVTRPVGDGVATLATAPKPPERPALAAALAALTGVPAEDFPDRRVSLTGAGVFRAPQSFPGLETFAPWTTTDPAEAWEILVTAGLLGEDPRRTFDVYAHVVDGEIYRAPDGSVRIPGGTAGFEVRAIAEPGADEVQWAIRRGALGRKVAIPRLLLERGRGIDVVTESLRSIARQWPHPATIPDLVAVASLGPTVLGAEELCAKVAGELATLGLAVAPCERVVWRVAREPLSPIALAGRFTRAGRDTARRVPVKSFDLSAEGGLWEVGIPGREALFAGVSAVRELWEMGLALERVGAECVVAAPAIGA